MNSLNFTSFSNISKSYQEGVYSDSPANRKLGRVGMSYKTWDDLHNKKSDIEEGHLLEAFKIGKSSARYGEYYQNDIYYRNLIKEHPDLKSKLEEAAKKGEKLIEEEQISKAKINTPDFLEGLAKAKIEDTKNKDYIYISTYKYIAKKLKIGNYEKVFENLNNLIKIDNSNNKEFELNNENLNDNLYRYFKSKVESLEYDIRRKYGNIVLYRLQRYIAE